MVFYYVKDKIRTLVYAMSFMICLLVPHRITFFVILIDSIPNYLQLLKCDTFSCLFYPHVLFPMHGIFSVFHDQLQHLTLNTRHYLLYKAFPYVHAQGLVSTWNSVYAFGLTIIIQCLFNWFFHQDVSMLMAGIVS